MKKKIKLNKKQEEHMNKVKELLEFYFCPEGWEIEEVSINFKEKKSPSKIKRKRKVSET